MTRAAECVDSTENRADGTATSEGIDQHGHSQDCPDAADGWEEREEDARSTGRQSQYWAHELRDESHKSPQLVVSIVMGYPKIKVGVCL